MWAAFESFYDKDMSDQTLPKRARVAILFGVLLAFGFLIAALVTFIREGDWPAGYVSAGVSVLAVMLIVIRRRSRKR